LKANLKNIRETFDKMDTLPTWDILDTFFMQGGGADCSNPLVRHQIDSFNEFLDKKLPQIIQGFNSIQVCHNFKPEFNDYTYKIYINVLQPSLARPIFIGQDGTQMVMTPHLARMNNLTYATNMYVDVHIITEVINDDGVIERNENTVPGVCIGKIPIMVRSKVCVLTQIPSLGEMDGHECRYDPGGYFIINGNEKVIISQDRISENRTLVFAPNGNADGLNAEIRSMPDGVFLPPKTTSLHLSGKPNHMGRIIRLNTSFLRSEIPLFVMFRALGIESDKDIIHHILLDIDDERNQRMKMELVACAEDACDVHTQADAFQILLKLLGTTGTPREYLDQPAKAAEILMTTIRQDFLPHVGQSFRKKALYLGYMVRKLLRIHLGYQEYDNRDSYIHKRIDTPGVLFSNLFRQCYGKMIKEMRNLIVRELNLWRANTASPMQIVTPNNVHRFFKQTLLDTGLRYALSTGNWGVKTLGSFQNIRQGVAQVLNRMSYLSTLSHLRRINTPMEKNGKLVQPRKLENSQFGMICPSETPEGASVGLVKNLALSTHITINMSSAHVREIIDELEVFQYGDHLSDAQARTFLSCMGSIDAVHVIVNGDILGYTVKPWDVYATLKKKKRSGVIPPTTAVIWDIKTGSIQVNTEAGRMCRPLHIVEKGDELKHPQLRVMNLLKKKGMTWAEFAERKPFAKFIAPLDDDEEGILEYMDVEEIDNAMVAMFPSDLGRGIKGTSLPPKFTHCEIHPSLMNGVLAANIPFSDHNQSPRNCYQCLYEEEPVYMADGTWKKIKTVRVGDKVICFNPKTMITSPTTVIHQYVRPAEKPVYKVITASGRSIILTQDHKFMTNRGWQDVRAFDKRTLVGVHPTPSYVPNDNTIADITILTSTGLAGVDERLTSYGILPITSRSPFLPILARMVAFVQMRGSTPKFNSEVDMQMFNEDAQLLGFQEYGADDTAFRTLLVALEADVVTRIPKWIPYTDKRTKVEYLGGHFGGNRFPLQQANMMLTDLEMTKEEVGYRYNSGLHMEVALRKEYQMHVKAAADWEFPVLSWEEWKNTVEIKATSLFVPVSKIMPVRNCMISDITVESENHSFIGGGGFTVSNSAMGKQAVGIYMSNFNQRIDTMAHILNYPQKPLIRTKLSKYTYSDELPSGINAVVAIMTHTGFNQEDSVMVNKSAIDRGLFTSTYFKSYRDQCSKNHSTGEEEIFCKPDPANTAHMKPYNYEKLGDDGFVPKNTAVDGGDILIGKVMPHKVHGIVHPRDTSHVMKSNDEGFVDMNYTGVNGEAYKFAKVRLRKYRKPVVGDKLASRAAQKGTCGMTYNHQDMPFSKSGIVPDLIMNPHAIPSRMTIGQLMECIMGKAACHIGSLGDCTPFSDCTVEDIAAVLERSGMERYGNEILYNGRTGEMIQTEIFIGPTYYQRLKHMVADKAHVRGGNGPVVMLTRQPAEGRARNGGLRFGEMERDAIVAHGASTFLKERMLDTSDNYRVFICRKCGLICTANPEKNIYKCAQCKNNADITQVRIPYSMKLLMQELMTMGVAPRIVA
jgi:DNA-directed RNA polymerase beta subunit